MMHAQSSFSWIDAPGSRALHTHVLAWDGRIDNRADLVARLGKMLDGSSDATLLVAAYRRWGVPGLAQIVGDWSIVIHDAAKDAIVLASDYAGVRPLYYCARSGRAHWSFRLESLLRAIRVDALDEQYIAGFLVYGGCPNHTPYAGVYSVPPGHAVTVSRDGATTQAFWTMPTGDRVTFRDERRYDEQFRALFREAVAARLQEPGPVFAELSGGLDSSSVVCMANQLIRRGEVPASALVAIGYVYADSLDVRYIREVAALCQVECVHLSLRDHPLITEREVGRALPEVWAPVHKAVADLADERHVTSLLTGHNGDLVMGNWYDDSLQVAAALRRGRVGAACCQALAWSKLLRVPVPWIMLRAIAAALPSGLASPAVYTLDGISRRVTAASVDLSLDARFCKRSGVAEPDRFFSMEWMQAPPERRKHFHALTTMRELRVLQRTETTSFTWTHPFAHRPLVEFLMSVPADALCRPGEPRRLMRRALADLWPPTLRARRSKGLFNLPWFEALMPLAAGLLTSDRYEVVERGWVDRESFRSRLRSFVGGRECNDTQLRRIVLLEWWLRNRRFDGEDEVIQPRHVGAQSAPEEAA